MRSLTSGSADFLDPFGQTTSRFGEAALYRTSSLSQLFINWATERNRTKFGHEKYQKGLENITDNAGGQGTVQRLTAREASTNSLRK
jgi:hypothetical protein